MQTLECVAEQLLYPTAPFHFNGTVQKPSHFPSGDQAYGPGKFWQTLRWEDRVFGVRLEDQGTVDAPCVNLRLYADRGLSAELQQQIVAELAYRLDFYADLSDFYGNLGGDPLLGPVLERWRGMRVMVSESLYEYLVIATVLQNTTGRRSAQMLEVLFQRYGARLNFDGQELHAYWAPGALAAVEEAELRALKVGYRARTFKRQAELFASGALDEQGLRALSSAELKKALLDVYGVGPASVWYLMFEVFKRYDAFDHISPWEQKIYSRLLFNVELVEAQKILDEVESRWGRWKMLAAHYLFEDLFWRRRHQPVPWLEALLR